LVGIVADHPDANAASPREVRRCSHLQPETIRALADVTATGTGHADLILSGAFNTQVWRSG
jgi:hypothetical protein